MEKHTVIAQLLQQLTLQMQRDGLWQDSPPSHDKLESKLPFCLDTLTFSEWLQWVMFPRLFVLIETKSKLPTNSNMSSMAEQAFKPLEQETATLLALVVKLDSAINKAS